VASLKPKLFCGVAFIGEKFPSARVSAGTWPNFDRGDAYHLRHNICQTTVFPLVEQRLHPYRTNWTLLLFASDLESETADYTEVMELCQALGACSV